VFSQFRDRRELVEDDKRGGCPKSAQTEINVAADLLKNDHRIPSRMTEESLNIPKTVVLWILREISALDIFSCCMIQSCV
jgi:hypothetical protein